MKHLKALRKYFWKYRIRLSIGVLFIVISNYFGVLAPQVTGFIIDFAQRGLPGYQPREVSPSYDVLVQKFINYVEGLPVTSMQVVVIAGLTILALAFLRGFFMFLMRQTIIVMSRHIEFDQKNEVYDHYQELDAAFYKTHSTGDLMSRMAEDVAKVRMFTGPAIMYLINLVTLISLSVFFMAKRQPELTMYVLAPLPILAFIIYRVNTIIHKKSEALQASLGKITSNAQQSYSGIRVIKSFVQEDSMLHHFEENSESYKQQAIKLARVEALYFPSMTLLIGLSTLFTIMIGGIYYINGENNIGLDTLVEFIIYINMLTFPVSAIGWTASMIQRAAASQKRLNEFLHISPQVVSGTRPANLKGNIIFRDVSFTYEHTGIEAIKKFNLEIKEGQKIAIVGRTGSGKTTLAQLLMRMFDVSSGAIYLEGINIKELKKTDIRNQISYVPQDGFLFSETVKNNISFGAPETGIEKVKEAARQAVVAADIENFTEKYETAIGERGVTLSGGQKQRISIARALLKPAPVLILDDCLSAVDTRTEKRILENLRESLKGKTSIMITHRIFSLFEFDKVVVLQDGSIAEEGTHEELMKLRGIYYSMYQKQLREQHNEQ